MLRVYKNFSREGMISSFLSLRWNRRYNDTSNFELILVYSKEMFDLLVSGTILEKGYDTGIETILYKEDIEEACFLQDVNVYTDYKGLTKIVATGLGIESILSWRVAALEGTYKASAAINKLVNDNFVTAGPERSIGELLIGNLYVNNDETKPYEYKSKTNILSIIKTITQENKIGFRVRFDYVNKTYIFELYQGKHDPHIKYDKEFNNVINEEWFFLSRNYSNTVYVGMTAIGSQTGFKRREGAVSEIKDESISVTANKYLEDKKVVRTASVEIDTKSEQFQYLVDWNVGDIITFMSEELGTKVTQNVVEVHEFYEQGERKIDVIFGDYILR